MIASANLRRRRAEANIKAVRQYNVRIIAGPYNSPVLFSHNAAGSCHLVSL